ncbi:MAG: ComF family protein [Planctomycetes bacterium]|nr:ComF family protein [Planctomycetota bacterium]
MDVAARWDGRLIRLLTAVVDVCIPNACLLCRAEPKARDGDLCTQCRQGVAVHVDYCPRCARSIAPYTVHDGRCPRCRKRRVITAGRVRLGEYGSALADAIRMFKYGGHWELDRCLAGLLTDVVRAAPWLPRVEAMVAVPTCWQHRLRRRAHATTMMAPLVAQACGRPLVPLLRRVSGGPHQAGLSDDERVKNIRGRFRIVHGVTMNAARICLIDDVLTTGATLDECAKILRRAGATEIYGAVLAGVGGSSTKASVG